MPPPDFQRNHYQLFDLPVGFALDTALLGERFRHLQRDLHPDRYAGASAYEQRLAVQYSALVNEAYATLRKPLTRALYLLELAGLTGEQVAAEPLAGGFLIMQMELREKLEGIEYLIDPDSALDHLVAEIRGDVAVLQAQFSQAYAAGDLPGAAGACVKMQYLEKLLAEAEQIESRMMDKQD